MTLHLLQGNIDNRNMGLWASSEKHPDSDRALHCLVFHTFGQARAPRSFIAIPDKDQPRLHSKFLAYSAAPADEMRNIALTNQTPVTAGIMSPFSLVSSPLPDAWRQGYTLHFQIRVSPTYRDRKTRNHRDLQLKHDAAPTRETTYYHWLSKLLREKAGAHAPPEAMQLTRFRTIGVQRSPAASPMTVPDATIRGTCTIEEPDKWAQALGEGIGRNKAYGYGMLLLTPAH